MPEGDQDRTSGETSFAHPVRGVREDVAFHFFTVVVRGFGMDPIDDPDFETRTRPSIFSAGVVMHTRLTAKVGLPLPIEGARRGGGDFGRGG